MILNLIKINKASFAICKCDWCNAQITIPLYRANKFEKHYCNRICYHEAKELNHTPTHCLMCDKPIDNTFYDKSSTRPLCSKECYSKFSDKHYKQSVKWIRKTNMRQKDSQPSYHYPKQGKLICNYNLM